MIRGRIRHQRKSSADAEGGHPEVVEIDPGELSGIFRVPDWLRDIGLMAWLLLGIALLIGALVWLASLTQVIVIPVLVAAIVATVAIPLVTWLESHRVPRGLSALLVMLGIVGIAVVMGIAIVASIAGEASNIADQLDSAKDEIASLLKDAGVSTSQSSETAKSLGSGSSDAAHALLEGVVGGLSALSGLVFFLAMAALSTFFLLKDGPVIRAWAEDHTGLPKPVTRVISQRAIGSLRGYFLGTTIVAAFGAAVVGIGSIIIGVPYIGAIVGVTFIAGYIPYIGAWSAGAFTVLIALGSDGMTAAAAMIFVQLLANGVLQQFIQPFAMGAALGIHPLAVLVVTIAGGALFGAMGLILAAPVVSAIVGVSQDLAKARAEGEAEAEERAAESAVAAGIS